MPLGARTWYPAQDERNGLYQLQKAEERAAFEHAEKLMMLDRIREIRLRRESCHDTHCGSAYNLLPKFFVPGVGHHSLCNAAGGKALYSGNLSNPGRIMPVPHPSGQGCAMENQMVNERGQLNSNSKHENSFHVPMRSQNKNEHSQNQGPTLSKQDGNMQNSNHQKRGNQDSFGNVKSGNQDKLSNQCNGNQNSLGFGQDNRQKSIGNQQSGKEQNSWNHQNGNQKSFGAGPQNSSRSFGDQQSGRNQENLNHQSGNQKHPEGGQNSGQKSFGNQLQENQKNKNQLNSGARTLKTHQSFGAQEKLGNHQNRHQKISGDQNNARAQQNSAAHNSSFNVTQSDSYRKERGFEQQHLSRKEDCDEMCSRNNDAHRSMMKNEQRGFNTPASLGIGNSNEDRDVNFSQGSKYSVIREANYSCPKNFSDDYGSPFPREGSCFESRASREEMLKGNGDAWNADPGEPHHLRFQHHYDYLLGKEINRVLSLASAYPDNASYSHRRSTFSGF